MNNDFVKRKMLKYYKICTMNINEANAIVFNIKKLQKAKESNQKCLDDFIVAGNDPDQTGCKTYEECIKVNQELDKEIAKLEALKYKYNIQPYIDQDREMMYMLDPTKKGEKSKQVDFSPDMYHIDLRDGGKAINDHRYYRINPNSYNNFEQNEELFMLYPGTNQIVPKDLYNERKKFKIYPHMFQQNDIWEQDKNRPAPPLSPGGVDYPIPMRFQLRYLQQGDHPNKGHNIDYDIHIKQRSRNLPEYHDKIVDRNMIIAQNVDYDNTDRMQRMIHNRDIQKEYDKLYEGRTFLRNTTRKLARTVGVYGETQTKEQIANKKAQEAAVEIQPVNWYRDKHIPNPAMTTKSHTDMPQKIVGYPEDLKLGNIFKNHIGLQQTEIPKLPSYPSSTAKLSGFFELGPPLPPPSSLLLSNVPSDLLLQRRELIDPRDRITEIKETFSGGCTSGYKAPASCSITPNRFDDNGAEGSQHPEYLNIENFAKLNAKDRAELIECYKNRVKYYEDLEKRILQNIGHLFHTIPLLKQKEVESKIQNDIAKIHNAQAELQQNVALLQRLKRILSWVKKQRRSLIEHLQKILPETEFSKFHAATAKRVLQIEHQVGQYYKAPENSMIYAYNQKNFGGDTFKMRWGFYDFPQVGGLGNNKLSSLKIPADTQVVLFKNAFKQGPFLFYKGPRMIKRLPIGWVNQVSGIEVQEQYKGPRVELYDGTFFQGKVIQVPPGNYDYPDVGGIGNKKLASLIIPEGLQVVMYDRPQFTGEKIVYKGPMKITFLPTAWAEKVTAIQVQKV